ncbi:MAG: hypothetical protein FWE20_04415 [Defluviitaleaceae bacterium]|nr:hypothetical protein [Defluviitaleaceae bacterium]
MDKSAYFERLKNVDITPADIGDLVDIKNVAVNRALSREERVLDFIRQIKNPYCYKCGKAIVKVSFADTGKTLEDVLDSYVSSL